jgi:hypothetical protein
MSAPASKLCRSQRVPDSQARLLVFRSIFALVNAARKVLAEDFHAHDTPV